MTLRAAPEPRLAVLAALKTAGRPLEDLQVARVCGMHLPTVRQSLLRLRGSGHVEADPSIRELLRTRFVPRRRHGRVPGALREMCRRGEWATVTALVEAGAGDADTVCAALEALEAAGKAYRKAVGALTLWRPA